MQVHYEQLIGDKMLELKSPWVRVEDGLPGEGNPVLIRNKNGRYKPQSQYYHPILVAALIDRWQYENKKFFRILYTATSYETQDNYREGDNLISIENVTHWMPIPDIDNDNGQRDKSIEVVKGSIVAINCGEIGKCSKCGSVIYETDFRKNTGAGEPLVCISCYWQQQPENRTSSKMEHGVEEKHPMQPIVRDEEGRLRFKANNIITYFAWHGIIDINDIKSLDFSRYGVTDEDRMQLAQLLGYTVDGYCELSYVSDESCNKANEAISKMETTDYLR